MESQLLQRGERRCAMSQAVFPIQRQRVSLVKMRGCTLPTHLPYPSAARHSLLPLSLINASASCNSCRQSALRCDFVSCRKNINNTKTNN